MSLQVCPHCKHQNNFWKVYKEINREHFKHGLKMKCEKCSEKMVLKRSTKSFLEDIFSMLVWGFIPLLVIIAVGSGLLFFLWGIVIVTVYHFIAMYILIQIYNFKKK